MKGIVPIVRRDSQGSGRMRSRSGIVFLLLWSIFLGGAGDRAEANCWAAFVIPVFPYPVTFTGTDNVIMGTVFTDSGYVTDASIWIGGAQTAVVSNSDPTKTSLNVAVTWDSTHFAHNTVIEIRIEGHNNSQQLGRTYRPVMDKVYNKGSVFSHHEFEESEDVVESVRGHMVAMNHGITRASGSGWTTQNVLDSVKVDTIFHYSTHATEGYMLDDSGNHITTGQVNNARTHRTAPVHINLAFINGCESYSAAWANAFGISEIVGDETNRAYVGWVQLVSIFGVQHAAKTFWLNMKDCKTVERATEEAQKKYDQTQWGYPGATIAIMGDPKTKLHGVYEGSGWYY